ncbi:putative nucleotidyltransferase, ribonuclease H [Tanacetum coccineum]
MSATIFQGTRLAAFKLEGDALSWWKAHLRTQVGGDAFADTCTWVAFREIFYNRYFPASEQQRYEREYGSIYQLDRENSGEYMERFTRLASFVGATAGDAQRQARHFKWGAKKSAGFLEPDRSAGQRRSTETLPPPPLCTTCWKAPLPGLWHHYGIHQRLRLSPNAETYYVTEVRSVLGPCWLFTRRLLRVSPDLALPLTSDRKGFGGFQIYSDASKKGLCVPNDHGTFDEKVMTELIVLHLDIHPGSTIRWRLMCGKWDEDFMDSLLKAWGTRLKFSTAFHPQTDGQSERTIQTLEDMLRACALEWTGSWDEYLCLVEFAYNNSWHASIKAAPFELLYGRKCRAPICWDEVGERLIEGPELIEITNEKVAVAKEKLKEARSRQKSYADKHRRDLEFQVGDRVFLKVSPFRGVKRFGIKGKLSPRFIGPFEILERIGEVSYRLALPPQLSHVHDVFHVSLLRGYHYHPLHVASYPFDQIQPDMSLSEEPESILDRQERVMRNKVIPFVKILWKNHPEREATWETEESMRASYPHFFV